MPEIDYPTNDAASLLKSGKPALASRFLNERLRELNINPSGLPPHVIAHLRAQADDEAARIHGAFVAAVASLQHKADEQLRKQITRMVTFQSVGKAFGISPTNPPGGAAK